MLLFILLQQEKQRVQKKSQEKQFFEKLKVRENSEIKKNKLFYPINSQ